MLVIGNTLGSLGVRTRRRRRRCSRTLGRNDLCPCGSGKKYKKCCLNRATPQPAAASADVTEPRFFSPATSYYTHAALAEAMKPGGMVPIHPYVLIKLRSDPRLLESAAPSDRAHLRQLWQPSTVARMSDEEIEGRLGLLGVRYDRARFIEVARAHASAWAVADTWERDAHALGMADQEFVGLAACELWRRLCPERPSLEMLDDWLCDGYAFVDRGDPAAALKSWWRLWEALRPRLTAEMRDLHEAGERLFPRMSQCLSNWSVDFRLEAVNAALGDAACGELGIRFVQELRESLAGEDKDLHLSGDLAMLYFHLQRDAEAEHCCQQLIHDHPDRTTGYALLSDGLVRQAACHPDPAPGLPGARELLERALAYPVKDADDFDLPARLKDVRESLGRASSRTI